MQWNGSPMKSGRMQREAEANRVYVQMSERTEHNEAQGPCPFCTELESAERVVAELGTVVAITDSPLSPLVELADTWCRIEVPAIGPFDSSIPVVALSELLVAQVAKALKDDATNRIDRIETLWEKTEVFLDD